MKLLFVCNCNLNRSPTFEHWFKQNTKHDVRSCGAHYGYPYTLNEEVLEWADVVYLMTIEQYRVIVNKWPEYLHKTKIIGISDQYDTDDPNLIDIIEWWAPREGLL